MGLRSGGRVATGVGLSLTAAIGSAGSAEAADYTVGNTTDAGPGSLRAALQLSENGNRATTTDRILFESSVSGTIALASPLPGISEPLEIIGPGATRLTISGQDVHHVFNLMIGPGTGARLVTISGLTVDAAEGSRGPSISAIETDLTLRRSAITGSNSTSRGGAIYTYQSEALIEKSTISGNHSDSFGGAISGEYSDLVIDDSTVSGNTAGIAAGAINLLEADATITGSTISGNTAPNEPGGIRTDGADAVLTSTIVANSSPQDLGGDGTDDFELAFSLIEDSTGAPLIQSGPNILGLDPGLGPLAANGGATLTHAIGPGSPATDRGSDTGSDQRGSPRVDFLGAANATGGNGADIGAFEFQPPGCGGRPATIVGTGRVVNGTAKADVIVGTGARNVIRGRGGADRICGLGGRDRLIGGRGRDRLFGGKGKDTLIGGAGRDRLVGGAGRDLQRQ